VDDPEWWRCTAAPPAAGSLHSATRRAASAGRLRPEPRPTVWHIKPRKRRGEFLTFCRYLRSLYPPGVRIGLVLDNASAHLSTRKDRRVGQWAAANNVELAYTPTNASYLNRIEGPSPRCATSLWTAPTTPATTSRPA
jgi:hypothetical protein